MIKTDVEHILKTKKDSSAPKEMYLAGFNSNEESEA